MLDKVYAEYRQKMTKTIEVLETESDETGGRLKLTAFPLMRVQEVLSLRFKGRRKGADGALDIRLP